MLCLWGLTTPAAQQQQQQQPAYFVGTRKAVKKLYRAKQYRTETPKDYGTSESFLEIISSFRPQAVCRRSSRNPVYSSSTSSLVAPPLPPFRSGL
ncbi:hypothetical protein SprV_0902690900 [Sparganum proliferum]